VIVGIIDIGSNTARLLVATTGRAGELAHLRRERNYLRLGDDVHALGRIGKHKLREARDVAKTFSRIARKAGAQRTQTIVTAPGRQSENGDELVRILVEATGSPVEVISGDEEGRLAWLGAVARLEDPPETVAVIDLGGGSCEVAVGKTRLPEPAWVQSVDAGALRVTRAFLGGNPPGDERVATARREIASLVLDLDAPPPDAVLAVGGTARAIGRLVGRRFGAEQLDELTRTLSTTRAGKLTRVHGVTPERAQTVLGGALVLAEISRRLDSQLEVGRGGLRDGAALALTRAEEAA
jgi:exopolyphosphatase/guanosine-5'-triphosphate,3'-diphosphate pyrophosphatase